MKKKFACLFLVFFLSLSVFITVHASLNHDYNSADEVERQLELLIELNELIMSDSIVSYNRGGEPIILPRLTLILPPAYETDRFEIGLYIDIGTLEFGDFDEIGGLASQEVPEDIIDFILTYSGIPRERANVGYSVVLRIPTLPYDYIPSGICPVWGVYRCPDLGVAGSLEKHVEIDFNEQGLITPRTTTLFIGELVSHQDWGTGTVGHPANAAGSYFFSAFHRNNLPNNRNIMRGATWIGTISRTTYNSSVDITGINTFPAGVRVSMMLPSGRTITSFRGTPRVHDNAISIRGVSGVQNTSIVNTHAVIPELNVRGMMLTYPLRTVQHGDSGAALVNGTVVLGTLSGSAFHDGRWHGLYTNVQNYN